MHLIIGGAYQGKLNYAKENFKIQDADIFTCGDDGMIKLDSKCIYHLERYTLACVKRGAEPHDAFENDGAWRDSVIICEDIFCGVVPLDPEARAWREATGRLLNKLTPKAESVTRMFCGIAQKLK